jgi:hypothetical protein
VRVDAADVRRVIGEGGNPGIAQRQSDDALAGQIPDVGRFPTKGNMWCSHTDRSGRLRETTSSS